ncbi:MAG: hypothetical protein WC599_07985 [Bacteroidales bacterium]
MKLDNNTIDYFLSKSSFIGLLTLYFIKLRYDNKQAFNKDDLEKIHTGDYTYGYFVACSAFGLIEHTSNNNIINITFLNEYFSSKVYEKLLEKANNHDKTWVDDINRIENI